MTYRILTVCTGNICRSPMAEYALREAVEEAGLEDRVEVASVATSRWEVGNPIDPRAAALLERHGIDTTAHRARQMDPQELAEADLVLTLDHDHAEEVDRAGVTDRRRMMRDFDPEAGNDTGIRDPWYGDDSDFETAWEQINAAIPGILDHVRTELAQRDPGTTGRAGTAGTTADAEATGQSR